MVATQQPRGCCGVATPWFNNRLNPRHIGPEWVALFEDTILGWQAFSPYAGWMTERQFKLLADAAIVATLIAIALIVLSPSGSLLAGGAIGQRLTQQETWLVHGTLFAGLGFVLAVRVAYGDRGTMTLVVLVVALLLLSLLGGLAEVAQLQIDSRSANYGDWVGDSIGSAVGLWTGALTARPLMLALTRR